MATIQKKNLNQPEETRSPEKTKIDTITLDGLKFQRVTAETGWQWSKHIKPTVGGDSCQVHHLIYIISGKLHTRMDDGNELDFGPGDIGVIPPGHDGWNTGDEPIVWLELPHQEGGMFGSV